MDTSKEQKHCVTLCVHIVNHMPRKMSEPKMYSNRRTEEMGQRDIFIML